MKSHLVLSLLFVTALAGCATHVCNVRNVHDYGAAGDGKTDDTAAFQKALDAAGAAGGGTVTVGRGNFFFAGHLKFPRAVTLSGMWQSVPSHVGTRNSQFNKPTDDGTTFLVTENEGTEDGPGFITLSDDSTLRGVTIYYPTQKVDAEPKPFPWAIVMRGENPAVLDVELLNPYNGIDASKNERHLIRNVSGQPLRRGIYVDSIYDIGRIENAHFNPWWSVHRELLDWQQKNGEAFIFGRSDWEYVLNTFCFAYKTGYKFIQTATGVCNGNFVGIGADDCFSSVLVENSAPFGLLICNGEFTAFHGPDPTEVVIGPTNSGSVRFVNCAFWGPGNQIAKVAGRGTVGFSDCTFCQWDSHKEGRSALQYESGTAIVNACEFQADRPQVELGKNVRRAVISDNVVKGKLRIQNDSGRQFQIHDNAALEPAQP